MTEWDLKCMQLAIQVAKIFPDPVRGKAVGAVLALEDEIISIGYRQTYIKDNDRHDCIHAEDMALASVNEAYYGLTLYVTMEPCRIRHKHSTWADRDSCTKQIITSQQIKHIVIGCRDGKYGGSDRLAAAGIQVEFVENLNIASECYNLINNPIIPPRQEENLRQAEENARLGGSD